MVPDGNYNLLSTNTEHVPIFLSAVAGVCFTPNEKTKKSVTWLIIEITALQLNAKWKHNLAIYYFISWFLRKKVVSSIYAQEYIVKLVSFVERVHLIVCLQILH